MPKSLRTRKQDLVRDAIHEAAIKLFVYKGFDQTTVEEVAQAAGVSRRSFFRYFASKDDLLAQHVLDYGAALAEAVKSCPVGLSALKVLEHTVEAGILYTESKETVTRQVVGIAERSLSARQAYLSRMMLVEDSLAEAFAGRKKKSSMNDMEPRLLSGITIAIMNATIVSWFMLEQKDLHSSAKRVFNSLSGIVSGVDPQANTGTAKAAQKKLAAKEK